MAIEELKKVFNMPYILDYYEPKPHPRPDVNEMP